MWWFLAVVVAFQLYFVRELLAAFALFAMGFAAIAFVVASVYVLQTGWEVAVERVAESGHPVVSMARRSVSGCTGDEPYCSRRSDGRANEPARSSISMIVGTDWIW